MHATLALPMHGNGTDMLAQQHTPCASLGRIRAPEKPEKEPKLLVELVGCDSPKPPPAAAGQTGGH